VSDRRPAAVLVLLPLWLMVFSVSSQLLIIAPILPRIAEQLGVGAAALAPLVTGYAVAVSAVALWMGPVSDRWGRRSVLLLGTAVMTVSLALHALAYDFGTLLTVRILAGAGGGALTGAAVAFVGDYFPPERRGWANGWVMSGFAAGQIVAVPLGAVLADRLGFQAPFLAFAVTMGASFVLIWKYVPQPAVRRLEGPLGMAGIVRRYGRILRRRGTAVAAAIFLLMFLGTSLYVLYLPSWLESGRGATAGEVAILFFAGGVATAIFGPVAGSLSDRIGRKPLIVGASAGVAVLMAITTLIRTGMYGFHLLFFALMALVAARASPFQAFLSEIVPDEERGSLMSLMMAVGQLGAGAGAAIAGAVYSGHGYRGVTLVASASVLLIAVAAATLLHETTPPRGRSVSGDGLPAPAERPRTGTGRLPG
jgi:predicted MFS family arabinose efflux permease